MKGQGVTRLKKEYVISKKRKLGQKDAAGGVAKS